MIKKLLCSTGKAHLAHFSFERKQTRNEVETQRFLSAPSFEISLLCSPDPNIPLIFYLLFFLHMH